LAATLDFTSFFTMAFLGAAHFFYSWAVFGLDLHDRMVLQFSKTLSHILKSAWRNLRLTKGFTLHITGIKPLCWYYTPHEVSEQFVQLLVD